MRRRGENGSKYQGSAADIEADYSVFQEGWHHPGQSLVQTPQSDVLHGHWDRIHFHLRRKLSGYQSNSVSQWSTVPRLCQVCIIFGIIWNLLG